MADVALRHTGSPKSLTPQQRDARLGWALILPAISIVGLLIIYPIIYNIEADPREMRNVAMENTWVVRPLTKIIAEYMATLKDHPNPPAANITVW